MNYKDIDQKSHQFYSHLGEQGIPVDETTLQKHIDHYQGQLDDILDKLQERYGFRPNPNQTAHYAQIAQQEGFTLPTSPSGRTRTDTYVIEDFGKDVPALIQLQKARSVRRQVSVLTNIKKAVRNGRVFPEYKLDEALGRAHSGGSVNPMNWGKVEQSAVRESGHNIWVVDYERLEPNVLATLSGDPTLKQDMEGDPYIALAQTIWKTQNISPQQRSKAKVALLAFLYGQDSRGLAGRLKIPRWEAKKIQNGVKVRYPRAFQYIQELIQQGRERGHATSYHGRISPLNKPDPDANDRLAVNSVIQNSGAELARIGFNNVYDSQEIKALGVKYNTTVHDSLILSVPVGVDENRLRGLLEQEMVTKNDPNFKMGISIRVDQSWGK